MNQKLYNTFVKPIIDNSQLWGLYLNAQNPDDRALIEAFDTLYDMRQVQYPQHGPDAPDSFKQSRLPDGSYELRMMSLLFTIWELCYRKLGLQLGEHDAATDEAMRIMKGMIDYVHEHYSEKVTLEQIARSGGICRSQCCQLFNRYINKTPIAFLNAFRLERAMSLLRETNSSITEIALSCGFNSSSYFSEMFFQQKGCTPSDYRIAYSDAT